MVLLPYQHGMECSSNYAQSTLDVARIRAVLKDALAEFDAGTTRFFDAEPGRT